MYDTINVFSLTLYPYSLCMITGGAVCFLLSMLFTFRRHKEYFDENLYAVSMLVLAIFIGLPSAMVCDSLFKWGENGKFVLEGATFYGGLIFALIAFSLLLLIKKHRQVPIYDRLCDIATAIPAGHFFGRIGCFLGGCCFGSPTQSIFGVTFPKGSLPYEYYGGEIPVHPTQLYEAFYLAVIFVILFLVKKHTFPLYLILYGAGRLAVEFFRNDDRGNLFGLPLSPAQIISIVLILCGAVILTVKRLNMKKKFTS